MGDTEGKLSDADEARITAWGQAHGGLGAYEGTGGRTPTRGQAMRALRLGPYAQGNEPTEKSKD